MIIVPLYVNSKGFQRHPECEQALSPSHPVLFPPPPSYEKSAGHRGNKNAQTRSRARTLVWPIDYFKRVGKRPERGRKPKPTGRDRSRSRTPETHLYARVELVMAAVLEPKGLVSCNCINRGDILGSGAFAPATAR